MDIKIISQAKTDFNSIKVRLEPSLCNVDYVTPRFQFHKGAIRTINIMST